MVFSDVNVEPTKVNFFRVKLTSSNVVYPHLFFNTQYHSTINSKNDLIQKRKLNDSKFFIPRLIIPPTLTHISSQAIPVGRNFFKKYIVYLKFCSFCYTFVQLQRYIQKLSAWKRLDWFNLIPWDEERDVQMHRSVKPHICTLNMHSQFKK